MSVTIKPVNLKEFNKVLNDYAAWNRKQPSEIVAAKLYFISLNAMNLTKTTDKNAIGAALNEPSNKYPDRTVAQMLTIRDLRNKNKKVKGAAQFAALVQKFIKRRQSHTNFLRSGWITALKKLDFWNKRGDVQFTKRWTKMKKPMGVKQFGKDKGDVKLSGWWSPRTKGTIYNFIGTGKQASNTVNPILQQGLNEAIQKEMSDMIRYIERKYNEKHDKLNKQFKG